MGASRKTEPLSPQQEAFVEFYLQSWNASEAARKAGYSPQSAREIGSRLLTNVNIKKLIKERLNDLHMTTNEWFARVTEQARGDMGDLIDNDGSINLLAARRLNKMRLITEYSVEESYRKDEDGDPVPVTKKKIKLYSSQRALDMIGQRLGQLLSDAQRELIEEQIAFLRLKKEEYLKRDELLRLLKKKLSKEAYLQVLEVFAYEDEGESEGASPATPREDTGDPTD